MQHYEITAVSKSGISIATPFGTVNIKKASSFDNVEGDYFITIWMEDQLVPEVKSLNVTPEQFNIIMRIVKDETR